jgi:nucleoside-diphosphate-sugar epimerase
VFGTENVINAVNAAGTVQRVVITASTASVFTDGFERGEGHVFTEADWNVSATPTKFPYFYSKKLAEQVRLAGQRLQDSVCMICADYAAELGFRKVQKRILQVQG